MSTIYFNIYSISLFHFCFSYIFIINYLWGGFPTKLGDLEGFKKF